MNPGHFRQKMSVFIPVLYRNESIRIDDTGRKFRYLELEIVAFILSSIKQPVEKHKQELASSFKQLEVKLFQ